MSTAGGLHRMWRHVSLRLLPFADAASAELPLSRLIRLSLFQVSVGMATVLMIGTLNRVMIVELGVAAWFVAAMVALPLLFAPFRALVGYRSDTYRSALGWRRVPFIWMGTMLQFGGFAIMPFALLVLTGEGHGPAWTGQIFAGVAFLMAGAGIQITQTAGLALATDLAPEQTRPRVVALMYVMLLAGMILAGFVFSALLADFSDVRLIQVVQGAAVAALVLNVVALWKQEGRDPALTARDRVSLPFQVVWQRFAAVPRTRRFLVAVALGTAAFNMQDIILEPYGGEILGLGVGATTALTAILALGALGAFALSAHLLMRGFDPPRLAALGVLVGLAGFSAVIFASPLASPTVFRAGVALIGFGGGLFSVSTLTVAMALDGGAGRSAPGERLLHAGLALGAWGAVQATASGTSIALGGLIKDAVQVLAMSGRLGPALVDPSVGYSVVYHLELFLLFTTLIALGPLVRRRHPAVDGPRSAGFGLAQLPG
jgi:BCD family chlorophyll transporter-like MFS transporter